MDLNIFFFPHCDYPRGKNSNCRKCLVFLPLMGRKKKKTCQWKVNSHEVPRKAIIGPSGRTEGRNGPVGDKVAWTGLQTCGQPWAEGCWPLLELGMATPTSTPGPSRWVFKGPSRDSRWTAHLPPASRRALAPDGPSVGPDSPADHSQVRPGGHRA